MLHNTTCFALEMKEFDCVYVLLVWTASCYSLDNRSWMVLFYCTLEWPMIFQLVFIYTWMLKIKPRKPEFSESLNMAQPHHSCSVKCLVKANALLSPQVCSWLLNRNNVCVNLNSWPDLIYILFYSNAKLVQAALTEHHRESNQNTVLWTLRPYFQGHVLFFGPQMCLVEISKSKSPKFTILFSFHFLAFLNSQPTICKLLNPVSLEVNSCE